MRSAVSRPGHDFASILDQLEQDALGGLFRPVSGLERFWPDGAGAEQLGPAAVESRYAENLDEAARTRARARNVLEPDPGPEAPNPGLGVEGFQMPDFKKIAAEIARSRSPAQLRALRRTLALATHPDRVPAESRTQAEVVMAKVNAAIDSALSAL
jgi:hypothetical protein